MKSEQKWRLILCMLFLFVLAMTGCKKEKDAQAKDINLKECTIVYDKSDYMSKRYAYRLFTQIRVLSGKGLECVSDDSEVATAKIIVVEDDVLEKGSAKIEVKENTIICSVNSYYGFEAVLDYFVATYEKGKEYVLSDGFAWTGSYRDTLEEAELSDGYAYNQRGDYRVMFNNVLWLSPMNVANDKAGERNMLTVEMIKQYMPDVVGLQECNASKRENAQEQNIVTLLKETGYAEVQVTANNTLGVNCTPIFYKQDTMIPVTGGYLNYKNQPFEETEQNQTSKGLTWCLFETKKEEKFIVISTHMETRDSSVRYNQAEEASRLIDVLREKYDVPIILGGDFNTVTGSTTFKYLVNVAGYTDASGAAKEFNSLTKPNHAYPQYKITKDKMDLNGMHGLSGEIIVKEGGMGVDHIVLDNHETMELNVYGVVVDDCTKASSDHFPTFIDFSIKE